MSKGMETALTLSSGSLESYIQSVSTVPVLSAEDERALATKYQQQGDLEAARKLVLSNLRFVVHIARGYSGYGLAQADLIQEGNIGLMKAVKRFDPSMNVRLVSYAVHWIRAEIHEFILRNWRIVKVATTKAQRKLFFNLRSAKKRLGWLNQDEVNSVAADLGVAARDVMEMESRLSNHDMSYDPTPEFADEEGASVSPSTYLSDQEDENPGALLEHSDLALHNEQLLSTALTALDERSRDIVQQRWLSEDKATLQDLASKYQVSAERIRQLEKNAIKRLRSNMT